MPLQVQGSDKTKLEVHGSVRARFKITNSYKFRQKVHSSVAAGARQWQFKVRGPWQCQSKDKSQELLQY